MRTNPADLSNFHALFEQRDARAEECAGPVRDLKDLLGLKVLLARSGVAQTLLPTLDEAIEVFARRLEDKLRPAIDADRQYEDEAQAQMGATYGDAQ